MTRTQIQLPEPLFQRMKLIASSRDWSLAELIRRGMERYVETCPEVVKADKKWEMPILRRSGGIREGFEGIRSEVDVIELRGVEKNDID